MESKKQEEPILQKSLDRFILFPIQHKHIWKLYKKHEANFWTAEEIRLRDDIVHWDQQLKPEEKQFITHVLAFFAASDGIVNENLVTRFYNDVQLPEARCFYTFQMAMESIHAETYSLLLQTYVTDKQERHRLFHAVETMEFVKAKADWALKWISDEVADFAQRLLAFICVEGIFFSASFCAIFWFKKRGLLPGLCFSNESIARDEGLHVDFACALYRMLTFTRLDTTKAHHLFREAVEECEEKFVCEALSVDLIGMNSRMMCQYVRFVADRLLVCLDYPKLFNATNPFDWMEAISLQMKTNFFEKVNSTYRRPHIDPDHPLGVEEEETSQATTSAQNPNEVQFDADF